MKELLERMKYNRYYQKRLKEVQQLTPAYHALRRSLTLEQQKILEDYLDACEALDQELLTSAASFAGETLTEELYYFLKINTTYIELCRRVHEQHHDSALHQM